jgi:hypothetical protein
MLRLTALFAPQVSVTGELGAGDGFGLAVKPVMVGGGITMTFTVAVAVAEPWLLVAVKVYVVVAAGETFCVPPKPTLPTPLMLTVVAFSTTHRRVAL